VKTKEERFQPLFCLYVCICILPGDGDDADTGDNPVEGER